VKWAADGLPNDREPGAALALGHRAPQVSVRSPGAPSPLSR